MKMIVVINTDCNTIMATKTLLVCLSDIPVLYVVFWADGL